MDIEMEMLEYTYTLDELIYSYVLKFEGEM